MATGVPAEDDAPQTLPDHLLWRTAPLRAAAAVAARQHTYAQVTCREAPSTRLPPVRAFVYAWVHVCACPCVCVCVCVCVCA
jgi:hypothetical protein